MILLITGASHSGKTSLAQTLLEQFHYPYLSMDHLKMGLIRSGNTALTPMSSTEELTAFLWPITREIIKTAIENDQNLIIEGCYIPFSWKEDFTEPYLAHIHSLCLVLSREYIDSHFADIRLHANAVERRLDDSDCTPESVIDDNAHFLSMARQHDLDVILIKQNYPLEISQAVAQLGRKLHQDDPL